MQKPTQVVGRRVAAFVIDLILWFVVIAIAWYALTKDVGSGSCVGGGITINGKCHGFTSSGNRAAWIAISALVTIGIFIFMQGLTGKTPGKAMLGIKVMNGEGNAPGILRTIGRELLWVVDFWIVALIAALASQNNQRLGDMVAGTYVVDRNFAGALAGGAQAAVGAPPPSGSPVSAPPPPAPVQQQQQPQGGQPANWYPDPHGQARLRYWDGERWTEHTSA